VEDDGGSFLWEFVLNADDPFWNTALMAPRFLTSAFVAGPAFVIVVLQLIRRMTRMKIGPGSIQPLVTIPVFSGSVSGRNRT
jgi:Ni/Fe-hydrogenase subunit HybB-like protein